jgi:hypothetical protein
LKIEKAVCAQQELGTQISQAQDFLKRWEVDLFHIAVVNVNLEHLLEEGCEFPIHFVVAVLKEERKRNIEKYSLNSSPCRGASSALMLRRPGRLRCLPYVLRLKQGSQVGQIHGVAEIA